MLRLVAVVLTASAIAVVSPAEAHTTGLHDNCTNFNKKYPHGVGTRKAHDKTSGTPVTSFKRANKIYWAAEKHNGDLDRDNDRIACEKAWPVGPAPSHALAHPPPRSPLVTRLLVLALLSLGLVAVPPAAPATAGEVRRCGCTGPSSVTVAGETRRGYDRDKFRHWVDADGDCRDTRDEVLADESLTAVSGCDVQQGRWRSYYDGVVVRDSSAFDVDHLVPLAEAWDSGAKRWTAGTRRAFANDLGDARSLVAVTASSNRSKSDQDPAEWLPELDRCRYVREWTAVKLRWSLSVNGPRSGSWCDGPRAAAAWW